MEDAVSVYKRDGYCVLRNAIPHRYIDAFADDLARKVDVLAEERHREGVISDRFERLPFSKRVDAVVGPKGVDFSSWYRYWSESLFSRSLYDLITSTPFVNCLAPILGDEITFQGIGHVRPYLPRPLSHLRWHQDAQFYGHGTEHLLWNMVQVWLPLGDVGLRGGCIGLIPGSHRRGPLPTTADVKQTGDRRISPQEFVNHTAADEVAWDPVVAVPMRKGDVLLFTNLTIHTGLENRSGDVRWSIDIRFERTYGSTPLSPEEEEGYAAFRRYIAKHRHAPLRISGPDGPESWGIWQGRCQSVRAAAA